MGTTNSNVLFGVDFSNEGYGGESKSDESLYKEIYAAKTVSFEDSVLKFRIDHHFTQSTPPILEIPSDYSKYKERMKICQDYSQIQKRKREYQRKSLEGFENARHLYYDYLRRIIFGLRGRDVVKEIFDKETGDSSTNEGNDTLDLWFDQTVDYSVESSERDIIRTILPIRRIAMCDYYLELYDEAIELCYVLILIVSFYKLDPKMYLRMTLGVLSRISLAKGHLDEAKRFNDIGLKIYPDAYIMSSLRDLYTKLEKGERIDERYYCIGCDKLVINLSQIHSTEFEEEGKEYRWTCPKCANYIPTNRYPISLFKSFFPMVKEDDLLSERKEYLCGEYLESRLEEQYSHRYNENDFILKMRIGESNEFCVWNIFLC